MHHQTTEAQESFVTVIVHAKVSTILPTSTGRIPLWFDGRKVVEAATAEVRRQQRKAAEDGSA
jgi:hypothetical protein